MGSRVRMPWGKFAGDAVEDIPSAYIVTLLDKADRLDPIMRNVLVTEIIRRYAPKWEPPHTNPRGGYDPHNVFNEPTPPHDRTRVHVDEPRPTVAGVNGVPPVTSFMWSIVENGYKHLAKKYHPDVPGGSEAAMKAINEAVETLRRALPRKR